jgi:hypothetical protein
MRHRRRRVAASRRGMNRWCGGRRHGPTRALTPLLSLAELTWRMCRVCFRIGCGHAQVLVASTEVSGARALASFPAVTACGDCPRSRSSSPIVATPTATFSRCTGALGTGRVFCRLRRRAQIGQGPGRFAPGPSAFSCVRITRRSVTSSSLVSSESSTHAVRCSPTAGR